jgi:hypothetical protein
VADPVLGIGWGDQGQAGAQRGIERILGAGLGSSQKRLEFAEGEFNRVEVRRVVGQVE